ncbi:unnamed protein product [Durusdinium trenchii]|uniref:Pseudouridine synthase RsuA/RluA-like domain-containing protein n=1 Tax=Durusdinium trenchii TaxID=1381693 RepID=A0ABP0PY55_9DINO
MNAPRVLAKLRGILVIYKPPNWEVDAKRNKTVGSGRTRLLSHFVQDQETSRVVRLATFEYGFIHRLDVPSSGLVLVGTTFEGLATLQFQIHTYSIRREYAVLLAGCWPVAVVKVNMPVQDFQPARSFVDEGGRPADTRTKACKKENGLKGRFMSAAAKRRRTAFARNAAEEQGVPVEEIPIVHSGGQSRPLFTPRLLWDPESSEEEAEAGVSTGAAITLPRARPLSVIASQVVRLVPKSFGFVSPWSEGALKALLNGVRRVSRSRILVIEDENAEIAPIGHTQIAPFHPSARVFIVENGRHYTERPTGDGIPPRHIESLRFLREEINNAGNTAEIIICSHIERSQANLENLLYHTEISNLPVRDILITEQRYGEAGKLSACQALSSGLAFLYDDNPEVISEFWGSGISRAACQAERCIPVSARRILARQRQRRKVAIMGIDPMSTGGW